MPSEPQNPVLAEYLGRVRSHLPVRGGGDIVRELESSIRDRVDDLAATESRPPDDDLVRRALSELGEPEDVADRYVHRRSLVPPERFRAFVVWTSIAFALHLVLVGVATAIGRTLQFGPMAVNPVGPHGLWSVLGSALHALLLDVGLMVLVFVGLDISHRKIGSGSTGLRVEASRRQALGRAFFAVLVFVLLNVVRDRVFVCVSGGVSYPLFTPWFVGTLPLIDGVLLLSVTSDVLYVLRGETRLTLAVDAFHGVAGVACMIFLFRGDPLLALPPLDVFQVFLAPVNDFLARLGELVVGFLALALALQTVRRLLRVAQI